MIQSYINWEKRQIQWWKKKLRLSEHGLAWISFIKGILVGFNRMRSPGTTIKVITCITTPCAGTMCTVPNHLCSKDITIN